MRLSKKFLLSNLVFISACMLCFGSISDAAKNAEKNPHRSLEQRCMDKKDSYACYQLGFYAIRQQKQKRAMELYRRACELGEMVACRTLGTSLNASGKTKVANYFTRKACLLGDIDSCEQI